ncbi:MAG: CPBP family intramembrane metalloprotease [Planctomyces sp.]|nr:CPBP family intramembrane metalloprotease [Planctomyces sp.]
MNEDSPASSPMTQSQFMNGAAAFEGGLLILSFVLGWIASTSPTENLYWSAEDLGYGFLATIPMLLFGAAAFLSQSSAMSGIREFLREAIGPYLAACRIWDLFLLALLAGVCEEALFRGFLYFWMVDWNATLAVVICNLVFAATHAITPMYALLAGFLGLYLTALVAADPTPNLLIPITAHTLYDLIGFLVVVWDYRRNSGPNL